ncbi:hypothetical protein BAE44_0017936 [Dichanthelium oligosanthes]|uniref:Uncharacterized protein n=1 Tax=Dichanthelium oligosanthes TaxID=888268 RepID=A0A1E5V7N8_9POAL|nr:hypothetical protein BAE44_0017936 [Dichanthelium oligosanthes]
MEEKAADATAAVAAAAVDHDGAVYCSEHPYPPGATAAAGAGAGGICAFCLQEKLGMLVCSSKSSPFHPPPPPASASPPSSNRASSEAPLPLYPSAGAASRKVMPATQGAGGGGLKRSKSVAPRPEEPLPPAPAITADSPRKKSFWSFLHLSSSSSAGHKSASSASSASVGGAAVARRNSVSAASASAAALGGRLEAIVEPESPGRRSEGSSSSSFGRKVARSRSVGCGSRSFSGDFLERLSTGFGDCALRRVESHREPKPKGAAGALGHLDGGGAHGDDGDHDQHHRIKCAGFFGGGLGAAPPPSSSSYWLSAPDGASGGGSARGTGGTRSHRSWAWVLASPMRALRPTSSSSSKTIMAAPTAA